MTAVVVLRDENGESIDLEIAIHRGKVAWGSIPTLTRDDAGTVQLLEEVEYEFTIDHPSVKSIQPTEIFDLSNSKVGGRVRPRGRTGLVHIAVRADTGERFVGELEVRSRKLEYLTEYRWMLDRIASEAAELALSPFAASHLAQLGTDHTQTPQTLYQRFEFLRSRVLSDEFRGAVEQLRHRPHTSFEEQREVVRVSKPIRGGRSLSRQLTKPGAREPADPPVGGLTTLPRTVERITHEQTLDTVPNRFVLYVIEDWSALLDVVEGAVLSAKRSSDLPAPTRAVAEVASVREVLEEVMRIPAIRDAGRLTQFPSSNTVVRSRSGYREFLSAFQDTNALAHLQWDEADESLSAGQHDVPTLYEYWVFLEVARIVGSLGFNLKKDALLSVSKDGMRLELRKANEVVVQAQGERNGFPVQLELWFNKSFTHKPTAGIDSESWTVHMRPDVSLSVRLGEDPSSDKTWIHFDAKYKVKEYTKDFVDAEHQDVDRYVVPADVQKMHAYRDAIRRSAGAYVLYPGNKQLGREQYHELLPGLGAFSLRPVESGQADDVSSQALAKFIDDVIDHLTWQGTEYQRDRFWEAKVHVDSGYVSPRRSFLNRPPSDTTVLLGYVRSAEHWEAIESLRLYNMRADAGRPGAVGLNAPELGAELLLLYGQGKAYLYEIPIDQEVMIRRKSQLATEAYQPSGDVYLCVPFNPEAVLMELDETRVRNIAQGNLKDRATSWPGQPVTLTWSEIEPDSRRLPSDRDE